MNRPDIISKFNNRSSSIMGIKVKNSVLLPLVSINQEWQLIFQVRSQQIKSQPGEISFPGGKIEPGESSRNAAIRETSEELGIQTNSISIWGQLDLLVTPFNMMIVPYIGEIHTLPKDFNINLQEVSEVFTVPLDFFVKENPYKYRMQVGITPPHDFPFNLVPGGKNYPFKQGEYPSYFYIYGDYVIWGFTARIIKNFIDNLS
ncbi:NUDIX hydrolase [Natranaerobius thermophilus]|uniref:NUDIX hydrolase n=1 Tax=Natranaerobius thermophilus (strain ATCC BAA-1301 / DSM 18059 / JW/NM-WN-LF) TaxID=457570 RepID=B2A5X1_NATTJ|nr:CoA pyrophosphatase [Natranaerobius thermophilus]ACB84064.1 NUDIX hydrolase [Natranaerobius thermophilus JW/NM-WN-LF]